MHASITNMQYAANQTWKALIATLFHPVVNEEEFLVP